MKLIRECRMGLPKTFKTGATVGSYPKPLLHLGFDRGALDVIPTKGAIGGSVPMNVTYEDIVFCKPEAGEFSRFVNMTSESLPPIVALDFTTQMTMNLDLQLKPAASSLQMQRFIDCYNLIATGGKCPWKTVVFDGITGYTDAILSHISAFNPSAMADARQWAGMVGGKVRQTILSLTNLPCHVVVLLHSFVEKNELTGAVTEKPNVYSQTLRDDFFGLFSQVFYSAKTMNGEPVIWPSDRHPVVGIGPRWPQGLPKECKPDFTSIYGKEV